MKTPIPHATALPTVPAELARALEVAFVGRNAIGVRELAELLPMHRETIARHIKEGNLVGRIDGIGESKRRRTFTVSDVAKFLLLIQGRPMTPSACGTVGGVERADGVCVRGSMYRPASKTHQWIALSRVTALPISDPFS